MRQQFEEYLMKRGYSRTTPSGSPSTVYDYVKRIDKVCEWEETTWQGLARNIQMVLAQYEAGGIKEDYGNQSHRAVINALKRFSEYLSEQQTSKSRL